MIKMEFSEMRRAGAYVVPDTDNLNIGDIAQSAFRLGLLMFGNLLRECLVLDRLSKAAQNNSLVTAVGNNNRVSMHYTAFIKSSIDNHSPGPCGFVFDTAGGVLFAKLLNLFTKNKVSPMIGAAGISAFPMSAYSSTSCQGRRPVQLF